MSDKSQDDKTEVNENEKDLPKMPDPAEIKKELENMVKDKFGDNIQVVAHPMDLDLDKEMPMFPGMALDQKSAVKKDFSLEFDYKPKQIKEHLDKYVIKQDSAKKALSIAVCDHYNHIQKCKEHGDDENYIKQNVLMLGPTGVGKTYLVRMIAKLIGVPFVKADATRFTETGYVGANVDDLVRDLVSLADDNIELAQYGIIYFDEVDKLATQNTTTGGKDISGRGVQCALLKLMEETEIDLRGAHDMISQMQAFMDLQRTGKVNKKTVNTKHILFIVSGAFSGMEDIIKRRLKLHTIGIKSDKPATESENLFEDASTKDFIDFGFEPEFVGRLPVRLSCHQLSSNDLFKILKESEGSIVKQYISAFKSYSIDLIFKDEALKLIAEMAHREKTGARGLMTIFEKIFRDFKFELPSTDIRELVVTRKLIENPQQVLRDLLQNNCYS